MAYVFADGTDEERRLRDQSTVLDPLTARLLDRAGLRPGMRVLDLGSGAGNVTALAADAVGPDGSVVGVDKDPDAVERARRLMAHRTNVEFHVDDVCRLDGTDDGFDAVVGRGVLMYLPDPVAALRVATGHLRPGGLICMQEPDMTYLWASRSTPLWDEVRRGFLEAFERAGVHARMGLSLFAAFREAGLPDPALVMEAPAGGGASSPAYGWANSFRAMLPLMERLGIAVSDAARAEDLTERLDAEILAWDGIVLGPPLYGAWTTAPAT